MIEVGTRVGDCNVLARITAGGMGTLYLARRSGEGGFARYVALKVVHAHLATDPVFVRMFLDEARLSARVQHPNVVHVESLGRHGDEAYLVMEYVHGSSLLDVMRVLTARGRRLSPSLATAMALRIADGLHAAHEATDEGGESLGLVHRDVSPHNVLIGFAGQVKLIDFGIAKAHGRLEQTHTGSIRGKLAYMAPEQALRQPIDRRTDVYALGVVLWEMLTGRRMITGADEFALLDRVRAPIIVPPSHYVPEIPPALEAVVLDALAFTPDARPATAQVLRRRLATALPDACAYADADLADLMSGAMTEQMAAARARLPADFPAERAPVDPSPMGLLETLTVPAREVAPDGEAVAIDAGNPRTFVEPPTARRRRPGLVAAALAALVATIATVALVAMHRTPPATARAAPVVVPSTHATPAVTQQPTPVAPLPPVREPVPAPLPVAVHAETPRASHPHGRVHRTHVTTYGGVQLIPHSGF